jgi:GNAT superfamily N-acetyltransferase
VADLEVHWADAGRWDDLERLFGPRGACAGCWCQWWKLPRREWEAGKGDSNRAALREQVASGEPIGLIGYLNGAPVGWCAIAPRAAYPVLERSRPLARVDDQPVWSITCLFVLRGARRQGFSTALIRAASRAAFERGATIVEGYPVEPRTANVPDAFVWTGLVAAYLKVCFVEVARRSATRPIVRLTLPPG